MTKLTEVLRRALAETYPNEESIQAAFAADDPVELNKAIEALCGRDKIFGQLWPAEIREKLTELGFEKFSAWLEADERARRFYRVWADFLSENPEIDEIVSDSYSSIFDDD
jgi:hypothetical protein